MRGGILAARGTEWAVATPHDAATEAASAVFRDGGNAVDAALTAATVLSVVYPHMCGVGGDLFALVRTPDGGAAAIISSGAAPREIDVDAVRARHREMPEFGPIPVTVPGTVSGWHALLAHGGTIPWKRAFEPAIGFASHGVPVARSLASTLEASHERLGADPGMRDVFFAGGTPRAEGETLVQPALAATLHDIAVRGPEALYGGNVGRAYVAGLRGVGSPLRVEDLEEHWAEIAAPLAGRYRDLVVQVAPPPSQGFALLEMLAGIDRMGVHPDPTGAEAGLIARIFAAAAVDRDRHNADPRVDRVPVQALLDDDHIVALAHEALEGVERRGGRRPTTERGSEPASSGTTSPPELEPLPGDTVALATADASGRAVSLIQSLYHGFGAGILEPETGIVAHDRGACFTLDPESANVLAGRKRPAHTLMPVLVSRHGELAAVLGTMGGYAQPQINAMSILRLFDLDLDPGRALSAPRWLVGAMDRADGRRFVVVEASADPIAVDSIRSAGFDLDVVPDLAADVGHAQAIRALDDGTLHAASDPRADGSAAAG
jgi:gamma-glutamyltranspeptidase